MADESKKPDPIKFYCNDWTAFLDTFRDCDTSQNGKKWSSDWRKDFHGADSFEECTALARSGWLEEEARARRIADPIIETIASLIERTDVRLDVEAREAVDIGVYLTGDPECAIHHVTSIVEGRGNRIFRIAINLSVSAGIKQEVIIARGVVLAALCECLELGGYRVELTACMPLAEDNNGDVLVTDCRVLIKTPEQPLDMARVLYAFAHPSMFRGFGLRQREMIDYKNAARISITGGNVARNPTYKPEYDIFVDGALLGAPDWTDESAARAWIIRTLEAQGVELSARA